MRERGRRFGTLYKLDDTGGIIVSKQRLVVELIGPAGAGKTTLLRALRDRGANIQPDTQPSKIRRLPFFLSTFVPLLPVYLHGYRHTRWFSRREIRSMVYLKSGLHTLKQRPGSERGATILDHGPIYRLAFLRALGPAITASNRFRNEWTSLLHSWRETLDYVIWLDAPDRILFERIRTRPSNHTIKTASEDSAFAYLNDYRQFLAHTIAETICGDYVSLLRFDTSRRSVDEIADITLATFQSGSMTDCG